ncbi:hypothetical protein ACFVZ3_12780, partial [Kitasatospora purpeofusca]
MEHTVQWVRTSWTKRSRGGEGAARRNAAPVGFVLPSGPASSAHMVRSALEVRTAHVVRMAEREGFAPRETQEELRGIGRGARGGAAPRPPRGSRYSRHGEGAGPDLSGP